MPIAIINLNRTIAIRIMAEIAERMGDDDIFYGEKWNEIEDAVVGILDKR